MKPFLSILFAGVLACSTFGQGVGPATGGGANVAAGNGIVTKTNSGTVTVSASYTYLPAGSSYATVSNAFFLGGQIDCQKGDFPNMGTLIPASGTTVRGNGAVFHLAPGNTGFLIDCWPNGPSLTGVVSNFTCLDLYLAGDVNATYNQPEYIHPWNHLSDYDPYDTGQETGTFMYVNRHGMRLNTGAPGRVEGCTITGFGGYGVFMASPYGASSWEQGYKSEFVGNSSISNWYGLVMVGETGFEWLQPGASGWPTADYSAQFQTIANCRFDANAVGVFAGSGNESFIGCDCSGNYCGFAFGQNAHGTFTGGIIQHCLNGAVGVGAGMIFTANIMLADITNIICDSVLYADFHDNRFAGSPTANNQNYIVITNLDAPTGNPLVSIVNNTYIGPWSYGALGQTSGFVVITNMQAGQPYTSIAIAGNLDYSGNLVNGTDGSVLSGLLFSNILQSSNYYSLATNKASANVTATHWTNVSGGSIFLYISSCTNFAIQDSVSNTVAFSSPFSLTNNAITGESNGVSMYYMGPLWTFTNTSVTATWHGL